MYVLNILAECGPCVLYQFSSYKCGMSIWSIYYRNIVFMHLNPEKYHIWDGNQVMKNSLKISLESHLTNNAVFLVMLIWIPNIH